MPFAEALAAGKIVYCQEEVDAGVHHGRAAAEHARPAEPEDHLFAAARRGRVGRVARA